MKNKFKKLRTYLSKKNKFILQDPTTFEEKFALSISKRNTIFLSLFLFLVVSFLIFLVISYTSLKNYIPGYPKNASELYEIDKKNMARLQELENKNKSLSLWVTNLQSILGDQDSISMQSLRDTLALDSNFDYKSIVFERRKEDSLLRDKVTQQNGSFDPLLQNILQDILKFKQPFDGKSETISTGNISQTIYKLKKPSKIKNSMDGVVISKNQNSIVLQHPYNLVTVFKNFENVNYELGQEVEQGETLGKVTDSVFQFEVWHKGKTLPGSLYKDL